jgi:hypothetical protein
MRLNTRGALISVTIVILLLFVGAQATPTLQPSEPGHGVLKVNWIVHSDPSSSADDANAVCEKDEYIYAVGVDRYVDTGRFRIEKRLKSSGDLVKAWTYNPSGGWDELYDCVIVEDTLYAVGRVGDPWVFSWAIVALDLDLNMLSYATHGVRASYPSHSIAWSLTSDGEYLYIAGHDNSPAFNDAQWRVEKRRLKDLALVKSYTSNPSKSIDVAKAISINPVTGDLWVCGYKAVGYDAFARIEILSKDLELVKVVELNIPGICTSIAFDEEGNGYVGGGPFFIAKLSKHGDILRVSQIKTPPALAPTLLYFNNFIYAFVLEEIKDTSKPPFYFKHAVYVLDKDLNVVHKTILDDNINISADTISRRVAFDGENVYVAGSHGVRRDTEMDTRWTVYSISIAEKPREIAQTVTVTTTIEVTKTSILTETIRETHTITEILRETVTLPPTTYIVTETKTVREPVVERGNVTVTITETTTVKEVDLQTTFIIALATAILAGATLWLILRPRASRIFL